MSKRLKISQPVYSRYENDEKSVGEEDDIVKRVAEEFGVSPQWLTSPDSNNFIFESGSIGAGAYGVGQIENYYSVPKEFIDTLIKQQQMTEQLLALLSKNGVNL